MNCLDKRALWASRGKGQVLKHPPPPSACAWLSVIIISVKGFLQKFSLSLFLENSSADQKQACKKHELYVSFRDLGWQVCYSSPLHLSLLSSLLSFLLVISLFLIFCFLKIISPHIYEVLLWNPRWRWPIFSNIIIHTAQLLDFFRISSQWSCCSAFKYSARGAGRCFM